MSTTTTGSRASSAASRAAPSAIFLYAELVRAQLFDSEVVELLKDVVLAAMGKGEGEKAALTSIVDEFGAAEDTHAEERFISTQKHTKKVADRKSIAEKEKELSSSKQRDQKIYLTQEVWAKKEYFSKPAVDFLQGLLTRDVNKRLGSAAPARNWTEIKEHGWFASHKIDFDRLEQGAVVAPYIPKKEVNAKEEAKMKTFNTAGMKKLTKEDQDKWSTWDYTNVEYYQRRWPCTSTTTGSGTSTRARVAAAAAAAAKSADRRRDGKAGGEEGEAARRGGDGSGAALLPIAA